MCRKRKGMRRRSAIDGARHSVKRSVMYEIVSYNTSWRVCCFSRASYHVCGFGAGEPSTVSCAVGKDSKRDPAVDQMLEVNSSSRHQRRTTVCAVHVRSLVARPTDLQTVRVAQRTEQGETKHLGMWDLVCCPDGNTLDVVDLERTA